MLEFNVIFSYTFVYIMHALEDLFDLKSDIP